MQFIIKFFYLLLAFLLYPEVGYKNGAPLTGVLKHG